MAAGVPSTNLASPVPYEALQFKSKVGAKMSLPALIYIQPCPTAATLTSGTVVNDGQSLIGAYQLGGGTATTLSWGGDAAVTFSSSSGLLASFTTSSFLPTTLNYDQLPIRFIGASGAVAPTGITFGTLYYAQWVSATTIRIATSPGGTVIAYTDAGSGTIYCQAQTQYWGSPWLPAGGLASSDSLGLTAGSFPQSGSMYRIEIGGHRKGTGTNNVTLKTGLVTTAGATSWTAATTGVTLANTNTGPFNFTYTADIIVQQYGSSAISSPYVQGMVRSVESLEMWSSATAKTNSSAIYAKVTSIDLTQPLGFDVRYIAATPAVGEYLEPLYCRIWAYN